ncbi:MAG: hypothetical protein ACREJM_14985, partial [Candidatus Saccharimonadales bacterium]
GGERISIRDIRDKEDWPAGKQNGLTRGPASIRENTNFGKLATQQLTILAPVRTIARNLN